MQIKFYSERKVWPSLSPTSKVLYYMNKKWICIFVSKIGLALRTELWSYQLQKCIWERFVVLCLTWTVARLWPWKCFLHAREFTVIVSIQFQITDIYKQSFAINIKIWLICPSQHYFVISIKHLHPIQTHALKAQRFLPKMILWNFPWCSW